MRALTKIQPLNDTHTQKGFSAHHTRSPGVKGAPLFLNGNAGVQRKAACACGGGCPRCQEHRSAIQPKLTVSMPGDQYEQEADRVAEQVMRMTEPHSATISSADAHRFTSLLQRRCAACEAEQEDTLLEEKKAFQTKEATGHAPRVTPEAHAQINSLRGGGEPLSESARAFFEPRFGHDFSQVRVHADARAAESARAVNALAYTVGSDVVFVTGQFTPWTGGGQRLLAHELAHTIQQGASPRLSSSRSQTAMSRQTDSRADPTASFNAAGEIAPNARETSDVPPALMRESRITSPSIQRQSPPPASGPTSAPGAAPPTTQPTQSAGQTTPTPDPCEEGIRETSAEALVWLHDAVEQLTTYESRQQSAGTASSTPSADIARIAAALNYNFHTSEFDYTRLIRDRIRIMETRLRARTDLTVRCADPGDQECAVRSFSHSVAAYAEPNVVVFCNVGSPGNRPVSNLIHELAHAVVPNVGTLAPITTQEDTPRDRAYEHQRVYRYLSVEEALDNAESYGLLVSHLHQQQITPSAALPTDTLTNCAQPELVNSALARAENWNLMGYRWLQTADDFLRSSALSPEDQARLTTHSFGAGRSDIQRLVANYEILFESFHNGADVRCTAGGGRCPSGVLGFARSHSVTASAVNRSGSSAPEFIINLCPAWLSASEENRTRAIYALFILSRPDWMTSDPPRNILLQRTDAYLYVDLARDLTRHVLPPPRASTLAEHQLSDMGIRLEQMRRRLEEIRTQLDAIGVRLDALQRDLDATQRQLDAGGRR